MQARAAAVPAHSMIVVAIASPAVTGTTRAITAGATTVQKDGATAAKNVIMKAAGALVPAAVTDAVARAARIPAVAIEITRGSVKSLSEMEGEKPAVMSRAGNVTVAGSMSVTSVPLPLPSVPAAVMLPVPQLLRFW